MSVQVIKLKNMFGDHVRFYRKVGTADSVAVSKQAHTRRRKCWLIVNSTFPRQHNLVPPFEAASIIRGWRNEVPA